MNSREGGGAKEAREVLELTGLVEKMFELLEGGGDQATFISLQVQVDNLVGDSDFTDALFYVMWRGGANYAATHSIADTVKKLLDQKRKKKSP